MTDNKATFISKE